MNTKSRAGHKLDQFGKCRECGRSGADLHATCPKYQTAAEYCNLSKPYTTRKGKRK
jgi:hypothetical protein